MIRPIRITLCDKRAVPPGWPFFIAFDGERILPYPKLVACEIAIRCLACMQKTFKPAEESCADAQCNASN